LHNAIDPEASRDDACRTRLIFATTDLRLFAIDARSGRRCAGFGKNGEVALAPDRPLAFKGELSRFSVPAIVNGTIVLGSHIVDDYRSAAPPGDVRAFDARTGARLWTFDPIPRARRSAYQAGSELAPTPRRNVWAYWQSTCSATSCSARRRQRRILGRAAAR
jgi:quinoprotein glucose dehydrogenase